MPVAVPATPERARTSRAFALVAALALATVAAYFSVAGMAEIFPGDPVAVMVLAGTMEAGKLVIAGWLAAHWRRTNWKMRTVLMALVAGLALINAAGVFGKLVEAHVSVAATSRSGVTERIEALDARVKAQSAAVADLDSRIAQIDRAMDESTRLGRVTRAINIATQQRVTRDGLDTQRQAATATLVGLQAQRAALAGERSPYRSLRRPDPVSCDDGRRHARSRGAMADIADGAVLRPRSNRLDGRCGRRARARDPGRACVARAYVPRMSDLSAVQLEERRRMRRPGASFTPACRCVPRRACITSGGKSAR